MFKLHSFKNGYTFGYCYKYYFDGFTKTYQILPSDIDATKTVRERPRVPTLLTLSNFIPSYS